MYSPDSVSSLKLPKKFWSLFPISTRRRRQTCFRARSQNCKKRLLASSCLSICLSVCLHETTRLPLEGFLWNLIFEYFWKISREFSSLIRIWQEWRVLYMKTNINFWSYLAQLFVEREIFRTKVLEKFKTHILYAVTLFRISCRSCDNVENYSRAGQSTSNNMAQAHCMLDKQGYNHTLGVCNTSFPLQL
jgi:hypothetical protein